MTKTFLATLFAASLFSTAAMANTSADTAPSRLPARTSAATAKSAPSAAESAAIASMVWEGGEASTLSRPSVAWHPMAHAAASSTVLMASRGEPYQDGAGN